MVKRKIRIFGAGVRGQVIADLVRWQFAAAYELDGYYDDNAQLGKTGPGGVPIHGTIEQGLAELPGSGIQAFLALGTYYSWRNYELLHQLQGREVAIATLVAPDAHVSPSASIGVGAFVMSGVFVGAQAQIGVLFGANAGSVVEHHAVVGDNVLLGSGVVIAGSGKVGDHCFLGSNSTVLPLVEIGVGTLVGSGSIVSRNLPAGVVAVGGPAKPSRAVTEKDEVPSPQRIRSLVTSIDRSPGTLSFTT